MASKTLILITGANQGLGYYAAQQLASQGNYHVLIGSRDISKAEKAIQSLASDSTVKVSSNDLEPIQIDIDDDASIAAAVKTIDAKYHKLDILLNNAAIAIPDDEAYKAGGSTLRTFYRQHYETNVFGTVAAAEAFIPLLRKGEKRLAFTSSSMGSMHAATEDNIVPGVSPLTPPHRLSDSHNPWHLLTESTGVDRLPLHEIRPEHDHGAVRQAARRRRLHRQRLEPRLLRHKPERLLGPQRPARRRKSTHQMRNGSKRRRALPDGERDRRGALVRSKSHLPQILNDT